MRDLDQGHNDTAADRVAGVQARERAQLQHRRAGVHQSLEALAHQHFAAGPVALHVLGAPTGENILVQHAHLFDQHAHGGGVVLEFVTGDSEARPDGCAHALVSHEGRRFCRNASIPSLASAPANSSADVAAAEANPSAHSSAGKERSNSFVAFTAPGAA